MRTYIAVALTLVVVFSSLLFAGTGSLRPAELYQWIFINIGGDDGSGNCTWTDADGACWEYTGIIPQDPWDPNDPNYPRGWNDGVIRQGSGTCPDGNPTFGITLLSWLKYYDSSVGGYRVSREVTECTSGFQVAWDDIGGTAIGYPWIGLGLGNYKEAVTDSILSSLVLSDTYPCTLYAKVGVVGGGYKEYLVSIDTRLNDDVNWFINIPVGLGVSEKEQAKVPKKYFLDQNYPNPFNASTVIKYGLPEPADVKLEITNVLGQTVRVLVDEYQKAGMKQVIWDGKDDKGKEVPSGVYFYSIKTDNFKEKKRMVLVK